MIKITIDDYILLDTVNFIYEKGKFTSMEVVDEIEGNMNFEIKFLEDVDNKSTRLEYAPIDKFNGKINAYNFKGEQSLKEFMLLGTYKNIYSLHMQFSSRTMTDVIREVTISLFIKRKTDGNSKRKL